MRTGWQRLAVLGAATVALIASASSNKPPPEDPEVESEPAPEPSEPAPWAGTWLVPSGAPEGAGWFCFFFERLESADLTLEIGDNQILSASYTFTDAQQPVMVSECERTQELCDQDIAETRQSLLDQAAASGVTIDTGKITACTARTSAACRVYSVDGGGSWFWSCQTTHPECQRHAAMGWYTSPGSTSSCTELP